MPATRLLVLADPKMLPALASGLREGGRFDVLTLPFGDAGAGAAAQRADALAVFYGAPDKPVQAALQALAPAVRGRGGRVIAVLQREQAAQRDDCFKAGASDVLFMPMPKEQFVARLADAVGLSYAAERGAPATVQVGARGNLVPLAQATVTPSGVHAAAGLPFQPGETVRLSWGAFEAWGLVVRASPDAQVRFAGVAPDEDARIREWMRQAMSGPAAKPAVVPAAPASRPAPAAAAARPSPPVAPRPPPVVSPRAAAIVPPAQPARAAAPAAANVAGPQAGPPPGFAERPRIKDTTPVRPPAARPAGDGARPATAVTPPPRVPQKQPAAAVAVQPQAAAGLSDLFDDGAPAAEAPAPAVPATLWPAVPPAETCLLVGIALIRDKKAPSDVAPEIGAAAKKITGVLSLGERTALEKAGTGSHFADAMAARILLEVGRVEAARLLTTQTPAVVDDGSVKAAIQVADAAAARLQKEADGAISRGEVESLQLITASSAALSRDLHSFKEAADRLRGVGVAPRLGAGSLDPEIVLPGQTYRPPPKTGQPAQVRAELRDFQGLGESSSGTRRSGTIFVCMLALGAALINVLFFAYPHVRELPPTPGVSRIEISGPTARVTLARDFADRQEQAIAALVQVLRERGVRDAVILTHNGSGGGQLSVTEGKVYGMQLAVKRSDVALPVVPARPTLPQAPPPVAAQPAPQSPAQPGRTGPPAQAAAGQPPRSR